MLAGETSMVPVYIVLIIDPQRIERLLRRLTNDELPSGAPHEDSFLHHVADELAYHRTRTPDHFGQVFMAQLGHQENASFFVHAEAGAQASDDDFQPRPE